MSGAICLSPVAGLVVQAASMMAAAASGRMEEDIRVRNMRPGTTTPDFFPIRLTPIREADPPLATARSAPDESGQFPGRYIGLPSRAREPSIPRSAILPHPLHRTGTT